MDQPTTLFSCSWCYLYWPRLPPRTKPLEVRRNMDFTQQRRRNKQPSSYDRDKPAHDSKFTAFLKKKKKIPGTNNEKQATILQTNHVLYRTSSTPRGQAAGTPLYPPWHAFGCAHTTRMHSQRSHFGCSSDEPTTPSTIKRQDHTVPPAPFVFFTLPPLSYRPSSSHIQNNRITTRTVLVVATRALLRANPSLDGDTTKMATKTTNTNNQGTTETTVSYPRAAVGATVVDHVVRRELGALTQSLHYLLEVSLERLCRNRREAEQKNATTTTKLHSKTASPRQAKALLQACETQRTYPNTQKQKWTRLKN